MFSQNTARALEVAERGFAATSQSNAPDVAVDLALLEAFVHERLGHLDPALRAADLARNVADASGDPMLQLMSGLRQLRLRRLAQMQGDDAQEALARLAYQLGPNVLASRPTVLRELAAELGRWDVEFVRWAAQSLLDDVLHRIARFRTRVDFTELAQGTDHSGAAAQLVAYSVQINRLPELLDGLEEAAPTIALRQEIATLRSEIRRAQQGTGDLPPGPPSPWLHSSRPTSRSTIRRTTITTMAQKMPLLSLLQDTAVMDDLRNDNETLQAARSSPGAESLDILLDGNESGVRDGGYTQTEAIILLKGRPALLIKDGLWEDPESAEIRNRIAPAATALKMAIPKVGRVEILNFASDFVGTGWMIEEDLLITNRHVAELFGERRGATSGPANRRRTVRTQFIGPGHLVRRLDPAWGQTGAEAKRAEEETFFFTNCSPQHSALNQKTWLSLEDYILSSASTQNLKVSVFSGPVMNENDRDYRGVKIPEEFWKVTVIVNAFTGKLSATGYFLRQADYLSDLEFVFGEFKTYLVPISRIEQKTKLTFNLNDYDPLARTEARPEREIRGAMDLIL